MRYAVQQPPIGPITRREDGYHVANGEGRELGVYASGDEAVEVIWEGFLQQQRVRHAAAATVHGSGERHPRP